MTDEESEDQANRERLALPTSVGGRGTRRGNSKPREP